MSGFRISCPRLWIGLLLAASVLAGACGSAQAGGEGAAPPSESEPAAATEPSAKQQAVHCMWRNKGVTGFCAVGAGTMVGAACACTTIIEHKTHKFPGKVVVIR